MNIKITFGTINVNGLGDWKKDGPRIFFEKKNRLSFSHWHWTIKKTVTKGSKGWMERRSQWNNKRSTQQ